MTCPNDPPTYYRELGNYLFKGTWSLTYPLDKTPNEVLELCTSYGNLCTDLIVKQSNHSQIDLLDSHGGTIHLTRPIYNVLLQEQMGSASSTPSTPVKTEHVVGETETVQKTVKGPHKITPTVTALPRSRIRPITVTPLIYTIYINGTWNFVNGYGNVSGTITFGTEEMKCNWCQGSERQYGFVGIFSGRPVEGTYTYIYPADLGLTYTYHHHTVDVDGNLNIINPHHMELTNIMVSPAKKNVTITNLSQQMSYYRIATGLHLHYGDVIHLVRGGTALNIPSPELEYQAHSISCAIFLISISLTPSACSRIKDISACCLLARNIFDIKICCCNLSCSFFSRPNCE